ncbi:MULTISPECIES: DUF6292 family protein [unclassified Streptomyces]|uniref:DUF6292 family protein n=1 Tax=unclassified Streptomyces TaxID=2593676 RepID=UPI0023660B78|nr:MULTISPECIES: DUF6292 family protein [unclassified Streptomyces]MDF3141822.1 DUF6292 family protein [Streptomyces sp. T21Q-yed]WDF45111.1 DUF6292 family protein [Streptomyces sp. T12]
MIRAGRLGLVQTVADLAVVLGVSVKTLRNTQPYAAPGFPEPVSSPQAQKLLWDEEQTAAYFAGREVPALPTGTSDDDLLDRHEAAAECGVGAATWNSYKNDPQVAEHLVMVSGVEHWPRQAVRTYREARPGRGSARTGGRPKGSGDRVPREQLQQHTARLLDADPAVTAAAVMEELGVAMTTATAALAALRGQRIADLLEAQPQMSAQQAAEHLGYPPITYRRALAAARSEQRIRGERPYIRGVAHALVAAGLAEPGEPDVVELASGALAAVVRLEPGQGAAAVVWDERFGWRTSRSRRHPLGKDTGARPEGEGIRYLTGQARPAPSAVVNALRG